MAKKSLVNKESSSKKFPKYVNTHVVNVVVDHIQYYVNTSYAYLFQRIKLMKAKFLEFVRLAGW